MEHDDIVIGSGLAGLGVALGLLDRGRRVLVLAGASQPAMSYYDASRATPCAQLAPGGMGQHWHGVIPLGLDPNGPAVETKTFLALLERFYPGVACADRLGSPTLLVPWRAIRPWDELQRLAKAPHGRLELRVQLADRLEVLANGAEVFAGADRFRCRRVWLAAGALQTPALLATAFGPQVLRPAVSDHILCYVGLTDDGGPPRLERGRHGMFIGHHCGSDGTLYMVRPARFGFRTLDFGIEQRAVFGMPTGSAVRKIARRLSPGLFSEALYNRFGLFPKAKRYSVYAQVAVPDAYDLQPGDYPLRARLPAIGQAAQRARETCPLPGLKLSQRHDIYLPGIHLFHSLNLSAFPAADASLPVQVADSSALGHLGAEHHSFKVLCRAFDRARELAA